MHVVTHTITEKSIIQSVQSSIDSHEVDHTPICSGNISLPQAIKSNIQVGVVQHTTHTKAAIQHHEVDHTKRTM